MLYTGTVELVSDGTFGRRCTFFNSKLFLILVETLPLEGNMVDVFLLCIVYKLPTDALADPGGAAGAPPQQDQFLSFLHMFSPKSVRITGWHPPTGRRPPNGKSWIRHRDVDDFQLRN